MHTHEQKLYILDLKDLLHIKLDCIREVKEKE